MLHHVHMLFNTHNSGYQIVVSSLMCVQGEYPFVILLLMDIEHKHALTEGFVIRGMSLFQTQCSLEMNTSLARRHFVIATLFQHNFSTDSLAITRVALLAPCIISLHTSKLILDPWKTLASAFYHNVEIYDQLCHYVTFMDIKLLKI